MPIDQFIRKEILDLPSYHLDEHPGIKLNQNESPWDIPIPLKAEIIENLLKTSWNRYPLGDMLHLKKKMAKHLGVWPDNLVFANGSNVLIQALILATSVCEKILTFDPTFGLFEIQGNALANKVHRVELEHDFSIPIDNTLKAIKKINPRLIYISNPNAPTGNLFDSESIKKIIKAANCLVVVDEAYYPFSGLTLLPWMKHYDNLVLIRTFSKAFALGGLRLGWMIAEPEVARAVQKCLLPFCVSKMTHVIALTVLDNMSYVDDYAKKIIGERERVFKEMSGLINMVVHKSDANFILFETREADRVFKKLLAQGVIVRSLNDRRRLTNALRVTIGSDEENNAFLKALRKALT